MLTGGIEIKHDLTDIIDKNNVHLNFMPKTDTDLIGELYNQLSSNWPLSLKNIEVIPIVARSILPRPNTRDTLIAWLERKEQRGRLLVISNQPFIPYQNVVAKSVLEKSYQVETVGNNAIPDMHISIMLDAVARYLY